MKLVALLLVSLLISLSVSSHVFDVALCVLESAFGLFPLWPHHDRSAFRMIGRADFIR
ncbi:MAG: hypothetical protein KGJ09_09190 [Candidatus Omnitrophica bacterium]|nr:hypothetical protein [Candidatus Omnitrophota bacterium]